jgi:hypothetical protein
MGKRKVCEGYWTLAHGMHNFSTSTKIVQFAEIIPVRSTVFTAKGDSPEIFLKAKLSPRCALAISACGKEFTRENIFSFTGSRDDRIRKFQSDRRR